MRRLLKATIIATVFSLTSCSQEVPVPDMTMPVVNDENCLPENIASVDEEIRQQFADACSTRGTFKPSTGRKW